MGYSIIYTDETGKYFRFIGGTWAWRNHNPGNIYPGPISISHNQIGKIKTKTTTFAIFPDYQSGHDALIDVLKITYRNHTIETMMFKFAPPKWNPTEKYIRQIRRMTGVKDDKKIKDFTANEFEKLWKGIEIIESYKEGNIVEVYKVTKVRIKKLGVFGSFCIGENWISKEACIELAEKNMVDLEVCTSPLGNLYLRTPHNSCFQEKLASIIDKKHKETF